MIEYTVEVDVDGTKYWYFNGKLHREDGPAVEYVSGTKHWYLNGERHREDGPAIEFISGNKYWYLNGKGLTEEEFLNKTKRHVIIIDGKEIEISSESYKELQKSLK